MQNVLDRMVQRVLRHTDGMQMDTPVPRIGIGVVWPGTAPAVNGCGAGVCLVLQGAKQMLVGNRVLRYGAGTCFASVVELPTTRSTYELDGDTPYVATSLRLDAALLSTLLSEMPEEATPKAVPAYSVAAVSEDLLIAWDHYLALLDTPKDIPMLGAARERELIYRLIQSAHGPMLRQIAGVEGRLIEIRRVIDWLRVNFERPVAIKDLAEMAGMSVPAFNRHFRSATATSPLQYQKTLRLQAARRLLGSSADATRAAFAVGYESTSQFSREYTRLFGLPPKKDAMVLRRLGGTIAEILI